MPFQAAKGAPNDMGMGICVSDEQAEMQNAFIWMRLRDNLHHGAPKTVRRQRDPIEEVGCVLHKGPVDRDIRYRDDLGPACCAVPEHTGNAVSGTLSGLLNGNL